MKIHGLFLHNEIVLESEDLFPGISSSAFDEHNNKPNKRTAIEELEELEKQGSRLDAALQYSWRELTKIQSFLEKNKAMEMGLPSTHDIRYRDIKGMERKFPRAFRRLHGHFIKTTSPIFNERQKYIAKFDRALERHATYSEMATKLNTRMEEIQDAF